MKEKSYSIPGLIAAFLFFFTTLHANDLDGLWRNDRQNITIRIEQDEEGFRAKRSDQAIWYRYRMEDDDVYVDRYGNWYEVIDQDELEWNEASSNKRLIFTRVNSRDDASWDDRNDRRAPDRTHDPRDRDNDRWDNDTRDHRQRSSIEGRWYDRSTKERLEIEAVSGGYRVRTQHGPWEKYSGDRNGSRIRSRSGNVIQLIDRNTIRLESSQDRHEHIYIRQGNGQTKSHRNGHSKGHSKGHRDMDDDDDDDMHKNHRGKKSCNK